MNNLEDLVKTVVDYCDSGDLMTALSYFESNIRPVVESLDNYDNAELLEILKEQCQLIDDEEWQSALRNIDRLSELLNG